MFEDNKNPNQTPPGQVPPWKNPSRQANPPAPNPMPYKYPGQNIQPQPPVTPAPQPRPAQGFRPIPSSPAPVPPGQGFRAVPPPPHQPGQQYQPAGAGATQTEKDWGPLKPLRRVYKPTEGQMTYVLAQAGRVELSEEAPSKKRWTIIVSIIGILVIGAGTAAFIFFGRNETVSSLTNQSVIVTNTNSLVNNNASNSIFPSENSNTSTANLNVNNSANSNANAGLDSDNDGLTDAQEKIYGTNANNPDTDGDGYTDGNEVKGGYDPLKGNGVKLFK